MDPLLTTDDVATILRIDATTVRRMVQRKELDAYRVAGEYRFSTELLTAYLTRHQLSRQSADGAHTHPFAHLAPATEAMLAQAQAEAQALGHDYLGTEHILLSLLVRDAGSASQVLLAAGLDAERMRAQLLVVLHTPTTPPARCRTPDRKDALGVMPRVKQAMQRAMQDAHGAPPAPHQVLLAILADPDALAVQLVQHAGVNPTELVQHLSAATDADH